MKITYDLLLLGMFRKVRPPEEDQSPLPTPPTKPGLH